MLDLDFELDVNELYDPEQDVFKLIPEGWLPATIQSPEVKLTKDGTGQYVSWMLKIFGQNYAGRVLFDTFNIKNKSAEAQAIGRRNIGRVMHMLKIEKTGNLKPFDGQNVMIKIGQKELSESDKKYAEAKGNTDTHKNVILAYREFVAGAGMMTNNGPIPSSSLPPMDDDLPF